MSTQLTKVTAGTTTSPIQINSNQSVFLGPQVLGGSVLLQFADTQSGPWQSWGAGTATEGASFRLTNGKTYGWIQATATTQAATLAISDIGQVFNPFPVSEIVSICRPMASGSTTSETTLFSMRIPPLVLPYNFTMRVEASAHYTNNANAKTLQCRINGIGGTLFYQSGALASTLNLNFVAKCGGQGDGVTWAGFGSGLTNIGAGLSSTAFTSLSRDYISQETEIVITCTKATGTDAFVLESLVISLC